MFVSAKVICISDTACTLEIMDSELGSRKFCFDYFAPKLHYIHNMAAQLHHEWQKRGNTPVPDPPVIDSERVMQIQKSIIEAETKEPDIVEENPEVKTDASKE